MEFYSKTQTFTNPHSVGSLETVKFNWRENFKQTDPFTGKTIGKKTFEIIERNVLDFMNKNCDLFSKRLREGRVKWCHGDLHSGNIFVLDDKIYVFDAIEFNERFACSDVASDIAFLSMDLDFRHRKFLSDYFIKKYIEKTEDEEILKLLDFYKCYRAFVRGKVISFRIDDPNISEFDRKEAAKIANMYFQLALEYANKFNPSSS